MKVALIINGSKLLAISLGKKLTSEIEDFHITESFITERVGHASEIVQHNALKFDVFVAVGGDGTLHECASGLTLCKKDGLEKTVYLAVVPCGTGNDFARHYKLKYFPGVLLKQLELSNVLKLDVGLITCQKEKRIFLNVADVGLGPAVLKSLSSLPVNWNAKMRFNLAIVRTILSYRKKQVQLRGDDFMWKGKYMMVAICNGKYFGNGIGISPFAEPNDGYMDVTIIGNVNLITYLRYLGKLRRAEIIHHPEVHYFRTREMEITGDGAIELDGELPGFTLPVLLEVHREQLSLLL